MVLLPADALPEAFAWYVQELTLTPDDRFCFSVSPAHDPMLRDLILPLWLGASVYAPSRPEVEAPRRWLEMLTAAGLERTQVYQIEEDPVNCCYVATKV